MSIDAQTHIPKFAQADNKSIKELTVSVENHGWLYFRGNAKVKANDLFTTHREAMGLQSDDKMVLEKTWRDELGYRHNRYQQYYKGIEVMNGIFAEHFARNDDNMYLANGKIIEGLNADVTPSVKEEEALGNAIKHLGATEYAWQNARMESELKRELDSLGATYFPRGQLVVAPSKPDNYTKENYRFCWQFEITASQPASNQFVFVDAHTGEVVRVNRTEHNNGPAELRYYGTKEIDTQWQGGFHQDFRLYANDGDRNIVTKIGGDASFSFYDANNVRDGDDIWIGNEAARIDAATAHWVTTQAWDFYQNTFNRCGTDAYGSYLRVWSHSPSGTASFLKSGDYLLKFALNPNGNTEATLDIAGHEFTHAVLHYVRGPGYGEGGVRGENGALAESLGDIMGLMVERTTLGANSKNFTHGEECGQVFRNFSNPSSVSSTINGVSVPHPSVFNGTGWHDPTDESFDNGGIHHNCSVQNHWFFLLGNGRQGTGSSGISSITVNGIGFDKAAEIVYRSMTTGKLDVNSNFASARSAMIQSAIELFGNCSTEMLETAKAWAKVGVGNVIVCPPNPVFVSTQSPYGTVVCVNNLQYPYDFNAYDQAGTTFTWSYPSSWNVQVNGAQLTVNSFGSVYDGESAVISATSSTGQIGTLQLMFVNCTDNPLLKVKNTPSKLTLNVCPNPVSDLLALKSNRKKAGQIEIYDSIGRLILAKKVAVDEDVLDVSSLKNGLYLLKMSVENESLNASFFKN